MSFPNEEIRKYVAEHLVAFFVAGAVVLLPLFSAYAYVILEYKTLNEARVTLEKDRADARLEVGQAKLEVEKLQGQLTMAMDASKHLLEEVSGRQKQTEADKQQLAEAWRNIEAWRQKLNPDQEFQRLSEEFTAMGIDLNRCAPSDGLEKHQRARLVAQRLWYAAIQTNLPANIAFARSIQAPSDRLRVCANSP